jgi:energy-coupling factor transporter ATP-binding protein EcfA2
MPETRERLVEVADLKMDNDRRRADCIRPLALNIGHLRVDLGDRIFILADNGNGKSALADALTAILQSKDAQGTNLKFSAFDRAQPIRVGRLTRAPEATIRRQGGEPEDVRTLATLDTSEATRTLVYADDPKLGAEIIDVAWERNLTLMVGSDPDRLAHTLGRFVEKVGGRIVWLEKGRVFWDGAAGEFCSSAETLWLGYQRRQQETGHCTVGKDFIGSIRAAIRRRQAQRP